jgi:hypothetical protein
LVAEERRGLVRYVEPELLRIFAERLDAGGADAVLDLLRPQFEDAALALREALNIVNPSADPATILENCSAEELRAHQIIPKVVVALDRLGAVASIFGPTAVFPAVADPRDTDPALACGWLHSTAAMCTSGPLLQSCAAFQRPNPDVRSSPWLKTAPFLHSVESATERIRSWAENAWAAEEAMRPKEGRMIGNTIVDDPPRRNPFSRGEAA